MSVYKSYTPVKGSEDLRTKRSAPEVIALENAERAERVSLRVKGIELSQVFIREANVPVLLDVFDRLALEQDPLEQTLYLHLYRLSFVYDRNFCRVPKRELMTRIQCTERRFNKILAGLVAKKHVALIDRNRKGTLYRVFLPNEIFGQRAQSKSKTKTLVEASAEETHHKRKTTKKVEYKDVPQSAGAIVAEFHERFGEKRRHDDILEEVFEHLSQGVSLISIRDALMRFGKDAPKETPISALADWL